MNPSNRHLRIFVATRESDVPPDAQPFVAVDGTIPGWRQRFDHHVSGERTNVDALPASFDGRDLRGIGTPGPDMDAAASVVILLRGGLAYVDPEALGVLRCAAHWCDQITPHAAYDDHSNRLGRGLQDWFATALERDREAPLSHRFAALCLELLDALDRGRPLPFADHDALQCALRSRLQQEGRLRRTGRVGLIDLTDFPPTAPATLYAASVTPVAVRYVPHPEGGWQYVVGVNPADGDAPASVVPALRALAAREFERGAPALGPSIDPANQNWGGRDAAGGSPRSYGSRLAPDEVARVVAETLSLL